MKVYTHDRFPFRWAMLEDDLGNALQALGAREKGTERLEESVAAYRAALDVLRPAGASHYAGIAERNLARAEALLVERRGPSAAK